MRPIKSWICAISAMFLTTLMLTGCSGTIAQNNCNFAIVDYVSLLQWDGILYSDTMGNDPGSLVKGPEIGTISYSKSEHQCPREEMQDGDATVLKTGTPLYAVEGYKTSARIWAGDRLYMASTNPSAQTINDLMDIEGKIRTVRFISGNDGSKLMDFTPEANSVFIREFPKLKYIPFQELYKETKGWVGDKYWMQLEMTDGSTIRITYNILSPSFQTAYVTPELARLIEQQRKLIYAK